MPQHAAAAAIQNYIHTHTDTFLLGKIIKYSYVRRKYTARGEPNTKVEKMFHNPSTIFLNNAHRTHTHTRTDADLF